MVASLFGLKQVMRSETILVNKYTAKTPPLGLSGLLGAVFNSHSSKTIAEVANPYSQSFEGRFQRFIKQVSIYLGRAYRRMTKCLLNHKDARCTRIKTCCEAMPKRMRCDSLINSGFDYPLIETALDLTIGNSVLQLADKERIGFSEDLLAFFLVAMQDRPQLGVEKAIDGLSSLGFDSYPFLQKINISDIEVDKFRQSNAGVQEDGDDNQIAVCLPTLLRSDGFQKNPFFIFCQKYRGFSVLPFDLNTDGWIVINLTGVSQPAKEALDRRSSAIGRRGQLKLTVGLFSYRIRKKEAIDISGGYLPDAATAIQMIDQQFQISLLRSDRVGRSTVGKLVIHEEFCRVIECHGLSSVSDSSSGCQLHTDWLVMNRITFLPMYPLIGSVILRSPISWKASLSSSKLTIVSELEYRIDFTSAILSSNVFSVTLGLLLLGLCSISAVQQCSDKRRKSSHYMGNWTVR